MRSLLKLIVFLSILFGCSSPECPDEKMIAQEFAERLNRIKDIDARSGIGGIEFVDIVVLSEITQIPSKVAYGDVTVYHTIDDRNTDITNWKNWLDKNACTINSSRLDSVERAIISNNHWILID